MSRLRLGIWIWGGITIFLGVTCVAIMIAGALNMGLNGKLVEGAHTRIVGSYYALKDMSGLVGAVLGFSGLAWSVFFRTVNEIEGKEKSDIPKISR